jgi:hypothetical protein
MKCRIHGIICQRTCTCAYLVIHARKLMLCVHWSFKRALLQDAKTLYNRPCSSLNECYPIKCWTGPHSPVAPGRKVGEFWDRFFGYIASSRACYVSSSFLPATSLWDWTYRIRHLLPRPGDKTGTRNCVSLPPWVAEHHCRRSLRLISISAAQSTEWLIPSPVLSSPFAVRWRIQ